MSTTTAMAGAGRFRTRGNPGGRTGHRYDDISEQGEALQDVVGLGHVFVRGPSTDPGLVEDGLNPGRIARSAEIDYCSEGFVVQRNRVGIDPVANFVPVKCGENFIKLGDRYHEVRPGD